MPYKVLVVDDSDFFQQKLKGIIDEHPDLQVVGVASNGQEAIEKEEELRPDIISMDYEMPFLDGVSAVRMIMAKRSVPIIMFSSMTYEGARITLEALEAGAVDFIPKNFAEVSRDSSNLKQRLHNRLITVARSANPSVALSSSPTPSAGEIKITSRDKLRRDTASTSASQSVKPEKKVTRESQSYAKPAERARAERPRNDYRPEEPRQVQRAYAPKKNIKGKIRLLVIGASTGGPVALAEILPQLPASFPAPILVVQHMPENFTAAFAERLNRQSALRVKEAQTGDRVLPGNVLIAPGGQQMMIDRSGATVKILPGDDRVNYKPCVDITFASAASVFGETVLAAVLTGMGADGCDGARLLKERGATIWGQNKESCVVYGMPAAIAEARLADEILPLSAFAQKFISDV